MIHATAFATGILMMIFAGRLFALIVYLGFGSSLSGWLPYNN